MGIRYEYQEGISATPDKVFAIIDDLPQTSKWLPPCVSLSKVGSGPNLVGDKLQYVFRQGGSQRTMQGEILARVPNARLHCKYSDAMFDVSVEMLVSGSAGGCKTTHIIEIEPKTMMGKFMKPLIRLGLRKQTQEAATNLKKLVEAGQ